MQQHDTPCYSPFPIQIRVSPPDEAPETQVFRELFSCPETGFSLIFSLIGSTGGNCTDKTLHAVGTFALHLVSHMAVYVQRKGRCGVTQIALHGFDVVPGSNRGNGVGVPLRYNYDKPEKPRISRVFGYLARFFILFQTEKSSREVVIS